MMFLKVGCLNAVIFSDLPTHQVETYDLVVDRYVHLLLQLVEVVVRQEGVFNIPLNSYLFLMHHYHVSLENCKLVFGYLAYIQVFVFLLDNVTVIHLLVNHPCSFVHQFNVIVLISHHNCVKIGKYLEICYQPICCKCPDS